MYSYFSKFMCALFKCVYSLTILLMCALCSPPPPLSLAIALHLYVIVCCLSLSLLLPFWLFDINRVPFTHSLFPSPYGLCILLVCICVKYLHHLFYYYTYPINEKSMFVCAVHILHIYNSKQTKPEIKKFHECAHSLRL